MTARNGIRTENKMKRLAAAVGVALAAMLAAASLSPARADAAGTSDGNLVIDVPTTVPCALMADGTVVSPSDWKITTSGDAYISSASASGFPANVEWSARTTDLAATQAGAVQVAGTGDAATVSGPSDPAAATLAGTARFEWSFSKLDAGKNADVIGKAAGGTAVLGSVTFTFAKPASAFAIYSADDNSLTFYKRANVPAAGQMFEGKTVTEVYEGMEKASYTAADGAPWAGHAAELASVTVADEGIAPVSTAYWFNGASKLRSVDIAALDTSQTTCMDGMFQGCSSLESLDLSAMSTRRVASMTAFLGGCDSLAELSIGSEFAWVGDDCYPPTGNWKQGSTGTDYSESQIPSNKTDKYNRVKTAFAVYSADDQSLTFYKRFELPANGAQFLGKTATRVYTGFETKTYASAGSVPWSVYASSINAVTMADEGVAPVSTSCWFYSFTKVKSFDLSKLDTRKVTNMNSMFFNCGALTALDLSSFDTLNATNMGYMFYGCKALTTLDVSSFDTQNATNMSMMFDGCSALTTLDVSSFDTRNVISMYGMFDNCSALTSLDLSMFDTSSVVNMNSMFFSCGALTTLDVSSFNTENVTNMGIMFEGCSALTSLDISSFHTGNVKDMNRMFSNCFSLTALDLSSFDTRNVSSMYSMFSNCFRLTSLDLSSFNTSNVKDMSHMFYSCSALTSLDLSSLNTSNVTKMGKMFYSCKALTSLDLSSFDTQNATDMYGMFDGCKALQKVAFGAGWRWVGTNGYLPTPSSAYIAGADGKWYDTDGKGYAPKDIPSNKAMTYTAIPPKKAFAVYSADDDSLNLYKRAAAPATGEQFEGKTATEVYEGVEDASYTATDGAPWALHAAEIASVTVEDAGVSPVSTAYWFKDASKLSSVSLAGLDTSQTTCMDGMFQGCSSLESLDLSAMSTRRVASMTAFLGGCDSLAELSIGSEFAWVGDDCYPPTGDWKQGSTGTDYSESQIPANKADEYTRAKTAFAVYSADDGSLNFYKRISVPATDDQFEGKTVTAVYTGIEEKPTSPQSPWRNKASKIKTATVVDNGIKPVSTANWLGSGYYNLIAADFTKLDTSNVTDMGGMFNGCYSLTTIGDLSNWNTSNVTNMSGLFATCPLLTTVGDLSNWDTRNVTNMGGMFSGCKSLTSLDLSTFDTRNVTNMGSMFYGCKSLTTLDLSSFDTVNVTDMRSLFQDCNALTVLDLSSFDTGNVTDMACIFTECVSLERISLGTGFKWVGWNCYPRAGNWESSSTGKVYSQREIPSGVADTYVFKPNTKASTAVNATSDPVDDDSTAVPAAASTCKAQGESATQKAVEGAPPLEEKASEESSAAAEAEGAEKNGVVKPEVAGEATKEDVSAIVPEGAEKNGAVKGGE